MVNKPLRRAYFWGVYVRGGGWLAINKFNEKVEIFLLTFSFPFSHRLKNGPRRLARATLVENTASGNAVQNCSDKTQ